jgi:hypothetical protein
MTDTTEATGGGELDAETQQQLAHAVDAALNSPAQAQGFLTSIPDVSGIKGKVEGILDTVLGAIDTVQQYSWLLGQYADEVQKVEDALRKVRGWLD